MSDKAPQTIFIVDDDADIRTSLSRAMRLQGHRVESYSSGQAFLEAYDPERQGCLLLDQGMPNMTGLELQQVLIDRGITLPTIFMSGHGGVDHSVQAMKNGALDFLAKPFPQKRLVQQIKIALALNAQAGT